MRLNDVSGVIEPQLLYTYDGITSRLGITRKTIQAAVRNGLKVSRAHRRGYILGQHWIDYVVGQTNDAKASSQGGADA